MSGFSNTPAVQNFDKKQVKSYLLVEVKNVIKSNNNIVRVDITYTYNKYAYSCLIVLKRFKMDNKFFK